MNQLSLPIESGPKKSGYDFELWISNLLRGGVLVSLFLLGFGSVLTLIHHPDYSSDTNSLHQLTTSTATLPHNLHQLKIALLAMRGQGFTTLGLLVLIATPILRVAVSALAFMHERDRPFVLITLIVLGLLMVSLFLGRAGD